MRLPPRKMSWLAQWGLAVGLLGADAGWPWLVFLSRSRSTSSSANCSHPFRSPAILALELSPTFSPDGSQVAFSWDGERQDNFDIYVKLVDRSDAVRLTSHPANDMWLRHGLPMGATSRLCETETIFLIAPAGRRRAKVTDVQAFDIAWRRDGQIARGQCGDYPRNAGSFSCLWTRGM